MIEVITSYDLATGAFLRSRRLTGDLWVVRDGEGWKPGRHDPGLVRVDLATGEIVPLMTMALTIETNRVTGLPPGSWAIVDLVRVPPLGEGTIDDGELELAAKIEGGIAVDHVARVTIQSPLYFPVLDLAVPCEA